MDVFSETPNIPVDRQHKFGLAITFGNRFWFISLFEERLGFEPLPPIGQGSPLGRMRL
jgi:hypothetical protein